jgi:pimeloyl-ACP methyl ester carboxylesterase
MFAMRARSDVAGLPQLATRARQPPPIPRFRRTRCLISLPTTLPFSPGNSTTSERTWRASGSSGMVAQVTALDRPDVFSALTLAGTRPSLPARSMFSKLDCKPRWRDRLSELAIPALVVHGRRPVLPRRHRRSARARYLRRS